MKWNDNYYVVMTTVVSKHCCLYMYVCCALLPLSQTVHTLTHLCSIIMYMRSLSRNSCTFHVIYVNLMFVVKLHGSKAHLTLLSQTVHTLTYLCPIIMYMRSLSRNSCTFHVIYVNLMFVVKLVLKLISPCSVAFGWL